MSHAAGPDEALACAQCGASGAVSVTYSLGGGHHVTEPLCPDCKDDLLEKRRVRGRRPAPPGPDLGRLGRVLIVLGALAVGLIVLLGATGVLGGDDGPDPCAGAADPYVCTSD